MASNILLVDDDKEIREWLELDLKFSGYNVAIAKDGAEGLLPSLRLYRRHEGCSGKDHDGNQARKSNGACYQGYASQEHPRR